MARTDIKAYAGGEGAAVRFASSPRAISTLSEIQGRHRKILLLLRRLYLEAQLGEIEGPLLGGYDRFVDYVRTSFEAEERLLSSFEHGALLHHRCVHREILSGLADGRCVLKAYGQITRAELLHCLDALVIHLTIDGAGFLRQDQVSAPKAFSA